MSRAQLTSTVEQNTGGAVAPFVAGKNKIINGDFGVFQRGATISVGVATKTYTADRWWLYANQLATVSQQSSGLTGFRYCARVQRTSGQGAGGIYLAQPVETANSVALAGQTVTLSFYARAGAGMTASNVFNYSLSTGTGTDESSLGGYTGNATPINTSVTLLTTGSGGISGTGWQRIVTSGTFASTTTEFAVTFGYNATGTAGANDYVEVTGVQVEIGSVATPFTTATGTLSGELQACQRYYQRWTATAANAPIVNGCYYSSVFHASYPFKVTMRTTPSMNASSYSQWFINAGTTYYSPGGSLGFGVITPDTTEFYVATTSSPSGGTAGYLYAGLNSYVEMSAEL